MTSLQKTIKYAAMAFAIFITISIISGIVTGVFSLIGVVRSYNNDNNYSTNLNYSEVFQNVKNLDIKLDKSNFNIKEGDTFKVEGTNVSEKFICKLEDSTLVIEENSNAFNFFNTVKFNSNITVYIPKNYKFNDVLLKSGVGEVTLEKINTNVVDLSIGVGEVHINELTAVEKATIEGGVGELNIKDSSLNNLSLKNGVGETYFYGVITGDSKIESGIGELDINIIGNRQDYDITTEKGIGEVNIQDNSNRDVMQLVSKMYKLDIEGGIGSINVTFQDR